MDIYEFIDHLAKESLKDLMPAKIPREKIIEDDPDHEYLLYTGQLYQVTPYLDTIRDMLEKVENIEEFLFSLYTHFDSVWSFIKPKKHVKERYQNIVKRAYSKLKENGIDVGYDFSIDYYSGVIFHDLGSQYFNDYARIMTKKLNNKKLITLDPHTTYAVKVLYKKADPTFKAEVHHYSEFLRIENAADFVDHESCYLVRYLNMQLTSNAVKPEESGKEMGCCGGPIEFVSPRLATEIAKLRMDKLLKTGKNKVLVWCPICLSNLSRLNRAEVKDALEIA